jgi:hypothetical protein
MAANSRSAVSGKGVIFCDNVRAADVDGSEANEEADE